MNRTRRRAKESETDGTENVGTEPKKLRHRKVATVNSSNSSITRSKYLNKDKKEPLTSLQNEFVQTEQKISKKASKHSVELSTETSEDEGNLNNATNVAHKIMALEQDSSIEHDQFKLDLMNKGLQKTSKELKINVYRPVASRSRNMLHYLEQLTMGMRGQLKLQKSVQGPLVDLFTDLEVYRIASPFDRRVTALEWHPTKPNILAVGSKGGDIILWDVENYGKEKQVDGIGAAGSCQAMKFWPWDLNKVVSASINGTVTLHDFDPQSNRTLADTMDSHDHWYCSVDVNRDRNMVVAGRNNGILHVMSTEGRMIFEHRIHKNKITHVEFSPREEWLLCTASTDKTVQLWDVRQMKDRKSALQVLQHEKPVNSAYFSGTDGCRLLTTDQSTEIRVYRSPSWHLETTISHPHRFFQHITPFKATWHPLQDLIVCGRYPDKNFPDYSHNEPRSIDLFDADTGEVMSQLSDPSASGLCSLNKFNRQGDALASGMGLHTIVWNRAEVREVKQERLSDIFIRDFPTLAAVAMGTSRGASGQSNRGVSGQSRAPSRPQPRKKTKGDDTDTLKKKKHSKTAEKSDSSTNVKLKSKTKMNKKEK